VVTHDIVKRHAGLPTLADRADSLIVVSPFAATAEADKSNTIIDITPHAHTKLVELRDAETEGAQLGLRLEILSQPGEDFRYDLSFDFFTKAAFSDEVRTINGLKIIIPAKDIESFQGAVIDHSDAQGLLIRNPNKPKAPNIEGLVRDDEVSGEVNPALAAHGGFVTFAGHDTEGTAYFTMGGGCHGCSMSRQTMLEGVQTTISAQVPQITKVRDLTDHSTGANPFYS
jgi:Fe/S biogenesis protein NfuA